VGKLGRLIYVIRHPFFAWSYAHLVKQSPRAAHDAIAPSPSMSTLVSDGMLKPTRATNSATTKYWQRQSR
jgi:hypothetical protein